MSPKEFAQTRVPSLPQSPARKVISLISADELDSTSLRAAVRRLGQAGRRGRSLGGILAERLGIGVSVSEAAIALVRRWHDLSADDRQIVAMSLDAPLRGAAAILAHSPEARDRIAAARAFETCLSGRGVEEIGRLTNDEDDDVRLAAVGALESLARRRRTNAEIESALDAQFATIADRVGAAGDRIAMAPSLLRLASAGPRLQSILNDEGHPAHLVWRSLIRRPQIRLSGGDLIRLLKVDPVAPAALDAIFAAGATHRISELCEASHLLLDRARLRRVYRHDVGKRLSPMRDRVSEMMRAGQTGAPRLFLICEGLIKANRPSASIEWAEVTDARTRGEFMVLSRQSDARRNHVREASIAFTTDPTSGVARSALLSIADDPAPDARAIIEAQRQSRHRICRRIADGAMSRGDVPAALRMSDELTNLVTLRRAFQRDSSSVTAFLRSEIATGSAPDRMKAIRAVRRLGVAAECELELLASLTEDDAHCVSAALMALAEVTSDSVNQAIQACLRHEDGRVRANAIEATARRKQGLVLDDAVSSECARERCNAARILSVRVEPKLAEQGAQILMAMLEDERPDHRRSGLWLAERLGRIDCAQRVATIAANDPDVHVRSRARSTARRLLAEMRADIVVAVHSASAVAGGGA